MSSRSWRSGGKVGKTEKVNKSINKNSAKCYEE